MEQAPILLEEYNPSWPSKFEEEKSYLISLLQKWLYGRIEHVGSTAVPGLVAKPVIDIMVGVQSLESARPAIELLGEHGYQYSAYKTEVMHWFCKPSFAHRTHHLYLIPFESDLWNERIKFRELLRSDNLLAAKYANLKRDLAASYKEERETYTEKKWPFIQQALMSA